MIDFKDLKGFPPAANGSPATDHQQVRFKDLASLDLRSGNDPEKREKNCRNLYEKATDYLKQVFAAAQHKQPFSLEPGRDLIRKMIEIQALFDDLFIMAVHSDDRYDPDFIIHHSINVAILAVKMGDGLGFSTETQARLGLAALLHDVGTVWIPEGLIHKKETLSQSEFEVLRKRPQYSHQILRAFDASHAYLAECAQQVYERLDGSGYPHGLKGDEIHEWAQIIGLVDMYEALIHDRPQRRKLLHFSAVKEIIQTGKRCFRRQHLKVLLSTFSIFPIYSYVRLNSDAIGKVIQTDPDQPMRPKLQIVFDSQKRKVLTDRIVNLSDNPLLYIVESVSEKEIQSLADAASFDS